MHAQFVTSHRAADPCLLAYQSPPEPFGLDDKHYRLEPSTPYYPVNYFLELRDSVFPWKGTLQPVKEMHWIIFVNLYVNGLINPAVYD